MKVLIINVFLRKSTLKENSASMSYEVNGETVEFEFLKEFITGKPLQ